MPYQDAQPAMHAEGLSKRYGTRSALVLRRGLAAVIGLLAVVVAAPSGAAVDSAVPAATPSDTAVSTRTDRSPSGRHHVPVPERRFPPRPLGPLGGGERAHGLPVVPGEVTGCAAGAVRDAEGVGAAPDELGDHRRAAGRAEQDADQRLHRRRTGGSANTDCRSWCSRPASPEPRSSLTALAEELASRGYVVAGIDHTYENFATTFPDGRVATCVACEPTRTWTTSARRSWRAGRPTSPSCSTS